MMNHTKRTYAISHYEQGIWIWDGTADHDGFTTANVPADVYDEMPLDADEDIHEFFGSDGVRYRIEAES